MWLFQRTRDLDASMTHVASEQSTDLQNPIESEKTEHETSQKLELFSSGYV